MTDDFVQNQHENQTYKWIKTKEKNIFLFIFLIQIVGFWFKSRDPFLVFFQESLFPKHWYFINKIR